MQSTYGAFKGLYRGFGIYWRGKYNVEGDGEYRTLAEARAVVDAHIVEDSKRRAADLAAALAEAKRLGVWAERCGDAVTLFEPGGATLYTLREWRNNGLNDAEDKYDRAILWVAVDSFSAPTYS